MEDDSEADVEDEEDDYDGGDDGDDDGGQKGTEEDCGHPDSSGHHAHTDQEKQKRPVSDVDFQKLVLLFLNSKYFHESKHESYYCSCESQHEPDNFSRRNLLRCPGEVNDNQDELSFSEVYVFG